MSEPIHFDIPPENRPETPKKKPGKKKRRGAVAGIFSSFIGAVSYILVVLAISLFLSTVFIVAANDAFALIKDSVDISVKLPENASVKEIAEILEERGVIKYASLFRLFGKLLDVEDGSIKAGDYELDSGLDYRALYNVMQRKTQARETVTLTIPEGFATGQIIELFVEKGVSTEEALWQAVENYDFEYAFLDGLPADRRRLEGYLYPDTYEFYVDDKPENAFGRMLKNFDAKFTEGMESLADEKGYTVHEILTIASLIEREAKLELEQPTVSGVIYNRLKSSQFPYLEIDATVQYILGHKGESLTQHDIQTTDDPYNTYKYKGLPPGPIANPGYNAIIAALNPESHGYYFYVAREDGSHIFTKTLDEHNAAVASVRNGS